MSKVKRSLAEAERIADSATAHIPLIGFSARNDGVLLAAQMHLDDLLPKPFDLDQLVALVSQWIAEGRRWRDTAAPGQSANVR